jgi:SAM-dependent methyltransferase
MPSKKATAGFRSLTYRSGTLYNWLNLRLYDYKKKFATLGKLASANGTKTVLDIPAGTGYLARYLDPSITYEGWDVNHRFLSKIKKDWQDGYIKVKKVVIRQKNIFDFDDYPDVDCIVFSGILHHVYPNHIELFENGKKHAKKIVVLEPTAVKPDQITETHDWIAGITMKLLKYVPEKIMKFLDFLGGDNDGVNSYKTRAAWPYNENAILGLYKSFGIPENRIYQMGDDFIGIWAKK